MSEELVNRANDKAKRLTETGGKVGNLVAEGIRDLTAINVDMFNTYCDLGFEQLRALLQVRDPKAAVGLTKRQGEVLQRARQHLMTDAVRLNRLAMDMRHELAMLMVDVESQVKELSPEPVVAKMQAAVAKAVKGEKPVKLASVAKSSKAKKAPEASVSVQEALSASTVEAPAAEAKLADNKSELEVA